MTSNRRIGCHCPRYQPLDWKRVMTIPDLDKDVFVICSCETTCRKDDHALAPRLKGEGARCSIWISRRHLAVIAASTLKKIKAEEGAQ